MSVFGALALSVQHSGCGGEQRYREVAPELEQYLEFLVDSYEGADAKQLFAGMTTSTKIQRNGFTGGLKKKYHAKFRHDPRLDVVAKVYAHAYYEAESWPASNLVDWMMWKLGITGRRVDVVGWWARYDGSQKRLTEALGKHAKAFKEEGEQFEYGIGRIKVGPMEYYQGLVIVEKGLVIDEIKKRYSPGEEILLRGKVNGEHEIASVTMTLGETDALSMPIDTTDDGKFLLKLPAPQQPGRHFLEIEVWREPSRWTTDLLVPIYVNVEEPSRPDDTILEPARNPPNLDDWPATLLGMMNKERASYGLLPLQIDETAQSLAQEYADKIAARWYRPMPDLSRLLREQGIKTSRTNRGVAVFEYLEEYFWDAINSPDLRTSILDDRFTHVGFGFTRDPDSEADRYIGIRFMFGKAPHEIEIPDEVARYLASPAADYEAGEPAEAFAAINESNPGFTEALRAAVADGLSTPVVHAPELDAVALHYALRGRIDDRIVSWILWKLGVAGTEVILRRRVARDPAISPYIVRELQTLLGWSKKDRTRAYVLGATRVPRGDGTFVETVVAVAKEVEIKPLKKHYEPGETFLLEGRFLVKAENPLFYMSTDGVEAIELPVEADAEGHFAVKTVVPQTPGRYFVELTVHPIAIEDKKLVFRQYTTLAVPIFVGAREPEGFDEIVLNPPSNPKDLDSWPERILAIYNAERAKHGLDPLRRNRLADALIADRLEQELQTFDPPDFKEMAEHLEESHGGFAWSASQSLIDSVDERARQILLSPSQRQMILDADVTMIGLGLALEGYYFMQMLVAEQPDEKRPGTKFIEAAAHLDESKHRIPAIGSLSDTDIRKVITDKVGDIEKCYDEVLDYYDDFAGQITVEFVIGVQGKVIAAHLGESTLEHYTAETCIVDAVRGWKFPAPMGDGVVFREQVFKLKPGRKKGVVTVLWGD